MKIACVMAALALVGCSSSTTDSRGDAGGSSSQTGGNSQTGGEQPGENTRCAQDVDACAKCFEAAFGTCYEKGYCKAERDSWDYCTTSTCKDANGTIVSCDCTSQRGILLACLKSSGCPDWEECRK